MHRADESNHHHSQGGASWLQEMDWNFLRLYSLPPSEIVTTISLDTALRPLNSLLLYWLIKQDGTQDWPLRCCCAEMPHSRPWPSMPPDQTAHKGHSPITSRYLHHSHSRAISLIRHKIIHTSIHAIHLFLTAVPCLGGRHWYGNEQVGLEEGRSVAFPVTLLHSSFYRYTRSNGCSLRLSYAYGTGRMVMGYIAAGCWSRPVNRARCSLLHRPLLSLFDGGYFFLSTCIWSWCAVKDNRGGVGR